MWSCCCPVSPSVDPLLPSGHLLVGLPASSSADGGQQETGEVWAGGLRQPHRLVLSTCPPHSGKEQSTDTTRDDRPGGCREPELVKRL